MNILITGASGNIGSFLFRNLAKTHNVFGISRKKSENNKILNFDLNEVSQEKLDDLLVRLDINSIIHCAGVLKVEKIDDFITNSFLVNKLLSTKKKGVKYIVIGSAAEYGIYKKGKINEMAVVSPQTNYGISKLLQTALGVYYATIHNIDIINLRLFNVLSPTSGRGSLMGSLIQCTKNTNETMQIPNLAIQRDFIDVRDIVDLINVIISTNVKHEHIYNVGSGKNTTYRDFLNIFKKILRNNNVATPKFITTNIEEDYSISECDTSKLTKDYNWKPRYSLEESLIWCLHESKIL